MKSRMHAHLQQGDAKIREGAWQRLLEYTNNALLLYQKQHFN